MKIIVPMAGMGKRMRPHTLTTPKPLIPIAGKPIVQRLIEGIAKVCPEPVKEVGFVTGRFGEEVETQLKEIAKSIGAEGKIYYQDDPLGTAHAIICAAEILSGKVIVAYADTLFRADFELDTKQDGIIWVQKVEDPSAFGVVNINEKGEIIDFIEKPESFISDLAIIGIYYFRNGEDLKEEIHYLIEHNLKENNEFQLTNALENMKSKGTTFVPGKVTEWLDCGNKDATVQTNKRVLEFLKDQNLISKSSKKHNSVIIPPVYLGEKVEIHNSVIGPFVSIGNSTVIKDSRVQNSIIQKDSSISNANIANSMLGNFVHFKGRSSDFSIGDYNAVIE